MYLKILAISVIMLVLTNVPIAQDDFNIADTARSNDSAIDGIVKTLKDFHDNLREGNFEKAKAQYLSQELLDEINVDIERLTLKDQEISATSQGGSINGLKGVEWIWHAETVSVEESWGDYYATELLSLIARRGKREIAVIDQYEHELRMEYVDDQWRIADCSDELSRLVLGILGCEEPAKMAFANVLDDLRDEPVKEISISCGSKGLDRYPLKLTY